MYTTLRATHEREEPLGPVHGFHRDRAMVSESAPSHPAAGARPWLPIVRALVLRGVTFMHQLPVRQVNRQYRRGCAFASKLRNRVWVLCAADLDPEAARAAATLAGIASGTSQAARGQRGQVIPGERACVLGALHFIFY